MYYTHFTMSLSTFMLLLFSAVFVKSQNNIVDEYVANLTKYQNQALTWIYPTDSRYYLTGTYKPEESIFDGVYDFIICGAGSSGSVMANRLSEIGQWKILLIDAGTWENNITDIPNALHLLRTSEYDWGYKIYPQRDFKGYDDNSMLAPRGKALGGSSVINAMIFARGNRVDFDKWAAGGSPGWSYKEMLPYFKKLENVSYIKASTEYRNVGGPVNIEKSRNFDEIGQAYLDAQAAQGRKILDYNGPEQMGFSILQVNEIFGRRDSGGKAYINRAKNRSNIDIFPNTLITKILIHPNNKTAYGVQYVRNGKSHYATVSKEVILSAGAFHSPQLLMLSGIGPKRHLTQMRIKVLKDLPVGSNLWDHLFYNKQSFSINYTYPNLDTRTQIEEYLQGKGPLSTAMNLQCIGFLNVFDRTAKVPDIEQLFLANYAGSQPYAYYKNLFRYTNETYQYVFRPTENMSSLGVSSVLLHPKSRGVVRLKSKSPFDFPHVDPNYFSDPSDVETLVRGIKETIKTAQTAQMQKYNTTIIKVSHPACDCYSWGSDRFWACMVRNLAETIHHYSGTCKMGAKNDRTTVVNANLQVHGIRNLRVADCSIIPVTLSGHPNAPAFAIGEKASDILKKAYGV